MINTTLALLDPLIVHVSYPTLIAFAGTCRFIRLCILKTDRWRRLVYEWRLPLRSLSVFNRNLVYCYYDVSPKRAKASSVRFFIIHDIGNLETETAEWTLAEVKRTPCWDRPNVEHDFPLPIHLFAPKNE